MDRMRHERWKHVPVGLPLPVSSLDNSTLSNPTTSSFEIWLASDPIENTMPPLFVKHYMVKIGKADCEGMFKQH